MIRFPGNQFKGEIVPALQDVVDKGLVRVIDITFVMKDEAGDLLVTEINEVDDDTFDAFGNLVEDEIPGLLSDEDIDRIADAMERRHSIPVPLLRMQAVIGSGKSGPSPVRLLVPVDLFCV